MAGGAQMAGGSRMGMSYMLSGGNLKPHVGHQVTVTGNAIKAAASETKPAHAESAQVQVSDLKMVSATCP